jgi:hypothetical protein
VIEFFKTNNGRRRLAVSTHFMTYDPSTDPDPERWLELDEDERLQIVINYHKRTRVKLPNARIHAAVHVTVENQLAERYGPTVETLDRLRREGVSRHDAIHAIGTIVVGEMNDMARDKRSFDSDAYERELNALSAADWKVDR